MRADQKEITNWLSKTIGNNSFNIEELRQEASDRKYYRIKADNFSYVLADLDVIPKVPSLKMTPSFTATIKIDDNFIKL